MKTTTYTKDQLARVYSFLDEEQLEDRYLKEGKFAHAVSAAEMKNFMLAMCGETEKALIKKLRKQKKDWGKELSNLAR